MYVRHFISPLPCRREIFNGAETGNELVWCLGVWYFFSFQLLILPSAIKPNPYGQQPIHNTQH